MAGSQNIRHAARILHSGGVIAYPTEGVFGLGCLPADHDAVARILDLKARPQSMGLIVIVSDVTQVSEWIDLPVEKVDLESVTGKPVTWIIPASSEAPGWICGDYDSIAVRLTGHRVARALCDASRSAIVSTSANVTGRKPARNSLILRRQFGPLVDYIVPGQCGPAAGPSEIRDYLTGKIVRAA